MRPATIVGSCVVLLLLVIVIVVVVVVAQEPSAVDPAWVSIVAAPFPNFAEQMMFCMFLMGSAGVRY